MLIILKSQLIKGEEKIMAKEKTNDKKAPKLVLIGNGFDLHHGLKTGFNVTLKKIKREFLK